VNNDFRNGVTIPIPKDRLGNINNVDNYRPITISPIISKMIVFLKKNFKVFFSLVIFSMVYIFTANTVSDFNVKLIMAFSTETLFAGL